MGTHFTLSIAQKASQGEYSLSKGTCGNCDAVKKKTKKNLTQQLTFVISPCTIHNEYNNNDDENHTPDNASNNGASIFVTSGWCRCWG